MIGERIRKLRKLNDLSQKELGEKLGISESTISNYEANVRQPRVERIKKMADLFDVSTDYLLDYDMDNPELRAIEAAIADEPGLVDLFEKLKKRDDLKRMFKETKDLPPETVRKVIEIIRVMEEREEGEA